MRVKSLGPALGLANARPPGSATFAVARGGDCVQVELTDALY